MWTARDCVCVCLYIPPWLPFFPSCPPAFPVTLSLNHFRTCHQETCGVFKPHCSDDSSSAAAAYLKFKVLVKSMDLVGEGVPRDPDQTAHIHTSNKLEPQDLSCMVWESLYRIFMDTWVYRGLLKHIQFYKGSGSILVFAGHIVFINCRKQLNSGKRF